MNTRHPTSRWVDWIQPMIVSLMALAMMFIFGRSPLPAFAASQANGIPAFVSEATCAGCHPQAASEWAGSHHDLAMQPALDTTVLGNFDDVVFQGKHGPTRFFRQDGQYHVNTAGPTGEARDYRITHTFGVEPLQQYLVALPGGALHSLTVAWDVAAERWFELERDAKPGTPNHWSGRFYRWNDRCAECHTTNLQRGYEGESGTFDTTWSRDDVGCQSCHGPAEAHLAWVAKPAAERGAEPAYGLPVHTSAMSARAQAETCAPCHSRRAPLTSGHQPGQPFLDGHLPALLRDNLYHPDGQIQDEVYVYGSFVQSKMYQRGVRCTDCHNPHSLGLKAEGNALCVQCHNPAGNPRFATLKKKRYDGPEHHFHPPGSKGAECVACHMPATSYMQVDPRRDHSMRIPRPDLSVTLGVPNACNTCHAARTPKWALDAVERWYGSGTSKASHFGQILARARRGEDGVLADLKTLVRDLQQSAIVRATAIEHLGPLGASAGPVVLDALSDEDALIRATAARAAQYLPPVDRVRNLWPLLRDPIRAVRLAAVLNLADFPPGELETSQQRLLQNTIAEFEQAQYAAGHQPEPYLNLGVLYERQGRTEEAETAYQRAIDIDPEFIAARVNLGHLYNHTGRNDLALAQLQSAVNAHPGEGELHYTLGLLLAEMKDFSKSAEHLGQAATLLPDRPRVHFNLGKILFYQGKHQQGEQALMRAHELTPGSVEFIKELLNLYMGFNRWQDAQTMAKKLAALYPNDPGINQLLQGIGRRMQR